MQLLHRNSVSCFVVSRLVSFDTFETLVLTCPAELPQASVLEIFAVSHQLCDKFFGHVVVGQYFFFVQPFRSAQTQDSSNSVDKAQAKYDPVWTENSNKSVSKSRNIGSIESAEGAG